MTVELSITSQELLDSYEIVSMGETGAYAVIAPRGEAFRFADSTSVSAPSMREMGSSSPSPFTSWVRQEYNSKLLGMNGLKVYDQMRKSDGAVRGTLRLLKTPVLAGRWYVEPATGPSGKIRPIDKKAADFVWKCLSEQMSISFMQVVVEALLMCEFGYYMFEKVWERRTVDGRERLVWKKLAPRHPMDVKEWQFDRHGGPAAVTMYAPNELANSQVAPQTSASPGGVNSLAPFPIFNQDVTIPIKKLLVFTFDKEAGNIEGFSILRTAYKHWYYKDQLYKIDAIQKERHGIGIPCIQLPLGYSQGDKELADQLGRNLRTNERAHIVLPPNWEIMMLKLEGQPVNALESIEHHNSMIKETILADALGTTADDPKTDLFLKSVRSLADVICDAFNNYAIPELFALNFPRGNPPKLKVRRIGEGADQRTLSFAVRNYVGSSLITPDQPLEDAIRSGLDLPPFDEATARQTASPQNPNDPNDPNNQDPNDPNADPNDPNAKDDGEPSGAGRSKQKGAKAGLPRQNPTPPTRSRRNSGTDRSGGK